jgi:hypothetical protein
MPRLPGLHSSAPTLRPGSTKRKLSPRVVPPGPTGRNGSRWRYQPHLRERGRFFFSGYSSQGCDFSGRSATLPETQFCSMASRRRSGGTAAPCPRAVRKIYSAMALNGFAECCENEYCPRHNSFSPVTKAVRYFLSRPANCKQGSKRCVSCWTREILASVSSVGRRLPLPSK